MLNDRVALLNHACRLRWPGRHLRGLADFTGRPKGTVAAWLSGRRNVPMEVSLWLADYLRQHGGDCISLGISLNQACQTQIASKQTRTSIRKSRHREGN
jgi:hypothetical protein